MKKVRGSNSAEGFNLLQSILFTAETRAECHREHNHSHMNTTVQTHTHITLHLLLITEGVVLRFLLFVFSGQSFVCFTLIISVKLFISVFSETAYAAILTRTPWKKRSCISMGPSWLNKG